jgi:hypothetical protein
MTDTHVVLKDALLDGQVLRLLGATPYGGADVAEVLAAARTIKGTDPDSWFDTWWALGERVSALGAASEQTGDTESAKLAHWRASNYFRNAGLMLMGLPVDPRLGTALHRCRDSFRRGAALMAQPPEVVEIPFEDTTLPGYFFRVDASPSPRATVIAMGGYDSVVEEQYFFNGAAALARGYNVLMFDGPGQGTVLVDQGLAMRPDWESVVTPVVDFAVARPDVDPARLALVGLSLGAYLAPRAASAEHRIAACVADCGSYDMYAGFLERLPGPLRSGFQAGNRLDVAAVREMLGSMATKPTAGWALRRGMQVHQVDSPMAYIEATKPYSLVGRAEHIQCPTWVCNAEGDDISASATDLVAALTCPHEFVTFTAAEGAATHCESGARTLYHARMFGWLDPILRPRG